MAVVGSFLLCRCCCSTVFRRAIEEASLGKITFEYIYTRRWTACRTSYTGEIQLHTNMILLTDASLISPLRCRGTLVQSSCGIHERTAQCSLCSEGVVGCCVVVFVVVVVVVVLLRSIDSSRWLSINSPELSCCNRLQRENPQCECVKGILTEMGNTSEVHLQPKVVHRK